MKSLRTILEMAPSLTVLSFRTVVVVEAEAEAEPMLSSKVRFGIVTGKVLK